jgi:hypothetical protein
MMRLSKYTALLLVLLVPLYADFAKLGTSGAQFLKIGVGRGAAMGEAFVAVADDASATYWNPSGLGHIDKRLVSLHHNEWIADIRHDYLSIVLPLGGFGTMGISLTALTMGKMEVLTVDDPNTTVREDTGTGRYFNASDYCIGFSFGRMFTDRLSAGLSVKAVQQTVWDMSAAGVAADFGIHYNTGFKGLRIAAAMSNFGGDITSHCIGNTSVIIACAPDRTDEQRFVLLTMAGFMGCLSGINEHGVGICCDYGYIKDTTCIPPNSLVPFTLSCRNAIECIDPDNSGLHDIYDVTFSMHDSSSLTCWDVHVFSTYDGLHPVPAGILEINNAHDSLRLVSDNHIDPAIDSEWNLVVTNHERVLYSPPYCYRYALMADSLNADIRLSTQRAIDLENAAAGWGYYAGTIQQIVLRPNIIVDHPEWPVIGAGYAQRNQGGHQVPKIWYSWNELFDGVPGIEEHGSRPEHYEYPATIIAGPLHIPSGKKIKVYDAAGRDIDPVTLAPGVYFIAVEGERLFKVVKIR